MVYRLTDELDIKKFMARIPLLLKKRETVEVTVVSPKTVQQNRYLHLLLGVLALETGNRMEFVKQNYMKLIVCPEIFLIKKDDPIAGRSSYLRSTATLTKEEISTVIEKLKVWSAEQGIYLPDAEHRAALQQIDIDMRRMQQYL